MVLAGGSPIGCAIGAWSADYFGRQAARIIGASVLTIVFGAIYPFVTTPAWSLLTSASC